jgi:outer membrane lipoprotein SlyB
MRRGILYTLLFVALVIQVFGQDRGLRIVLVGADSLVNVSIDSVQGTIALMTVGRKPMSVSIDSIARVYTLRPRGVVHGLVIGAFAGAALGFLTGEIIDKQNEKSAPPTLIFSGQGPPENSLPASSSDEGTHFKVILPIAGGVAGGIIGSAVALPVRVSSIDFTKKTLDEKRTYLEKLSKEHRP